eukprot:PLAT1253.1.p2 GENE.PLAT1253.1~~PLAT1253.1.p2  ORF type:complete len:252 (+),score=118.94 PLAT1253.1:113-757(+)
MLAVLAQVAEHMPAALLHGSIVGRLAATVNYFLHTLVSAGAAKRFKLAEPERIGFKPHRLLWTLLTVYRAVGEEEAMLEAMMADERSFRPDNLRRAAAALNGRLFSGLPAVIDMQTRLAALRERLAAAATELAPVDESLAPDEFLDPVSCALMSDPVRLPTSNTVMDRKTIETILADSGRDPFSRAELDASALQPLPELKARIDAWVAEARKTS